MEEQTKKATWIERKLKKKMEKGLEKSAKTAKKMTTDKGKNKWKNKMMLGIMNMKDFFEITEKGEEVTMEMMEKMTYDEVYSIFEDCVHAFKEIS